MARHVSAIRSRFCFGTMGLTALFAFVPSLAAQSSDTPTTALPVTATSTSSLPDAPTPTDAVLAASAVPSLSLNFFSTAPYQQASATLSSRSQSTDQNPSPPSLSDLGLTPDQTKPDPDAQARLDRRSYMLKIHQRLGLYTTIPIAVACISGAGAVPDKNSYGNTTSRDVHVSIAAVAIGMYASTAYYAIRAPRVSDEPARGGIKIHKYLIWIHAPGMILTPILGTMAFNDIASGHKPTGIAQYHQAVALTTAVAYGASIIAVSWPIHFPHHGAQ